MDVLNSLQTILLDDDTYRVIQDEIYNNQDKIIVVAGKWENQRFKRLIDSWKDQYIWQKFYIRIPKEMRRQI